MSPVGIRYTGRNRPLPDNYAALSDPDKLAARRNAVHCQMTPEDTVRAWGFFRAYYLAGTRKRELASPQLHYQWVYCCAKWARNMIAAPRSFA